MQKSLTDYLEDSSSTVMGVAIILDIFAASPDVVSSFMETGDVFKLLSDTLRSVHDEMKEQLIEELNRHRDNPNLFCEE